MTPKRASPERLREHVEALEGERHAVSSPQALEAAGRYVSEAFDRTGLEPRLDPFKFKGGTYHNVIANKAGEDPAAARVLVGAHFDTVRGTPGADDNGSGVAVLLEVARLLALEPLAAPVEFVAFNLEERQGWTYRVGSRHHAKQSRKWGVEYAGTLILESVGYRSDEPRSQVVPLLLRWKKSLPRTGDFVAVVGDGQSRALTGVFRRAAEAAAPGLRLVTFHSPLRGWIVWQTRQSDNASFWSKGYPSLLITDTAFLRNPHYHRRTDTADTLDYASMASLADATAATVRRLGRGDSETDSS